MNRKEAKKYLNIIVLVYLASFFIINWNDVSWIFNYREVSGLISDFFNPYPSIDASTINTYLGQNQNTASTIIADVEEIKTTYTENIRTLEIPKVSISVPIIFSASSSKEALEKDLDLGVVYYPGSVLPWQEGQIIVLGHSAPLGWPKVKYDWAFSDLDKLAVGDKIYLDLNNKRYTYTVRQKTIIQRGGEVPQEENFKDKNVLTLISCWPPGKDYQRIAVTATLDK